MLLNNKFTAKWLWCLSLGLRINDLMDFEFSKFQYRSIDNCLGRNWTAETVYVTNTTRYLEKEYIFQDLHRYLK